MLTLAMLNLLALEPPSGDDLDGLSSSIGLRFAGGQIADLFNGPRGIPALSIIFAGLLITVYFILGGYQIMLSRGDPKAMQQGKQKITYAIIGFFIIFTAFWVVKIIGIAFSLPGIAEVF